MDYDHLGFVEAVEELAARAGMEVPREGGAAAPSHPHDELYVAMERAALFFRQSLGGEARAKDYLQPRGLTAETIQRFGIGYAPARWDALLGRYGATDDERQILLRAGLIIERNRDERPARRGTRLLRPLPRPRDVPDPRHARTHDRLRRPRARPGRAEVPELARDGAVPQGPRALRPVRGAAGDAQPAATDGGRGLHGRREPAPGGHHLRRRHARHRDDAGPPAAHLPTRRRSRVLLRRRSRRSRRRVARARERGRRGEAGAAGALPVPARRARPGHAGAAGRRGGVRGAPRERAAAVGLLHPRTLVARSTWRASTAAPGSSSSRARWCVAFPPTSTASCW